MMEIAMSEAKHTPGPWSVGHPDDNGQPVVTSAYFEIATCWHHCVASVEKQAHANARLMAAAPDMLSVVKAFVAQYPVGLNPFLDEAYREALAAIAKAQGTD
jgi:hypothetical protein